MTAEEKIARIKKALHYAGDYHTWEDVQARLIEGQSQIFDGDDGCIITDIVQLPQKRYLNCWILGGRLPGVLDLVPEIERVALTNDCTELMAFGRRGWEKVLPKRGWKITGTTFSKELKNA